jgi:hypothetical protein
LPAHIFHKLAAATTDMGALPCVLGCRSLRRTVQVRLGSNSLRLPGGTTIFEVSRHQFMKYVGSLGHAPLPILATLQFIAFVWFAKTGFIPSFDLFRVHIGGNTFSTDPTADKVRWLIQNPGPLALYANVSHGHVSCGQR